MYFVLALFFSILSGLYFGLGVGDRGERTPLFITGFVFLFAAIFSFILLVLSK